MALVENSRERIGEKRLGVLFDGGTRYDIDFSQSENESK